MLRTESGLADTHLLFSGDFEGVHTEKRDLHKLASCSRMEDDSKEAALRVTAMLPTGQQSTSEGLQKEPKLLRTRQRGALEGQLLERLGRLEHWQQERGVQRFPGESDLQLLQTALYGKRKKQQ